MIFYNGFNLMVDLILAFIVWRAAYGAGANAGYTARDIEIKNDREDWQDVYNAGDDW